MSTSKMGTVFWFDLTVEDAGPVRAFYEAVCGWSGHEHPMGEYHDYSMATPDGDRVAGICHARGSNAALPPVWLPYVTVPSLAAALRSAEERGGEVVQPPRFLGSGTMAVIRDPAGAAMALWEAADATQPGD